MKRVTRYAIRCWVSYLNVDIILSRVSKVFTAIAFYNSYFIE